MKATPAILTRYDHSKLEDTESALAISPCPQIGESKGVRKTAEFARERHGLERHRQAQAPRQTGFEEDELTGTLTFGWAIALAIAVAVVIYASGA